MAAVAGGTHSAFTIWNGPEPVGSSMFLIGSVFAMRSGMMNGTFDEGLASASSVSGSSGCESIARITVILVASRRHGRAAISWAESPLS